MKKMLFAVTALLMITGQTAKADGLWDATKNYLQKYGVPCVAGMAAGYVIDRDKGVQIGSIGCVMVFTYGEFGRGSDRTITSDDVEIIQDMINKSNYSSTSRMQNDFDQKVDRLSQRIVDESTTNRQQIRNAVTDLGVFLDKDLSEKVDKKMENPALIKQIDAKINEAVKEEVQSEFKSKEREIVDKAAEKTIKRVTAEPIIIDSPAKRDQGQ